MTAEALGCINDVMEELKIPYEFMEWTHKVPDTYFVGQYTETDPLTEDGKQEADFLLIGTTNRKYLELEIIKEKLMNYLGTDGKSIIMESGSAVVLSYSTAYPVPSVQERVHRIQITLKVKEWRV